MKGHVSSSFCLVTSSYINQSIEFISAILSLMVDVTGRFCHFFKKSIQNKYRNTTPQNSLFSELKSHSILFYSKRLLTATECHKWPEPLSSNLSSYFNIKFNNFENFGGSRGLV